MKQEHYDWLTANMKLLGNVRMTKPELQQLFDIYNDVSGDNRPMTSCGRCVLNIKKRLKFEYEKRRSKN